MNDLDKPKLGEVKNKPRNTLYDRYLNAVSKFYKTRVVYRLFWGRTSLYRKFTHGAVFSLTLFIVISGFSTKFLLNRDKANVLAANTITTGNIDALEQGGNVQSILLADSTNNFRILTYKTTADDTFDAIASKFNVTVESIKLSNLDKISYYDDSPGEGKDLRIPEINGILITVAAGDTLDSIESRLTRGSRLDIIEINNLKAPDYTLAEGQVILVPDGLVNPPPPPTPQIRYTAPPAPSPIPAPSEAVFAGIQFIDPLSNPSCAGYSYSRGFSSWHNGVDLAKGGGCPIRAAASGTVEFAGWSGGGEGFMVRIGHGNGVKSLYFHGDGQIWVTPGQYVNAGQDIMYMGCTGRCTGTHLHFSIKYNGIFIDPSPYVPYWRP